MHMSSKVKKVIDSKERLTFGQVVDTMELGEIAVRVSPDVVMPDGYTQNNVLFFDECNGNELTSEFRSIVSIAKAPTKEMRTFYVILSKDEIKNLGINIGR